VQPLEAALGAVSIFALLRPDEIGRIASRITRITVDTGDAYSIVASIDAARLVIVLSGCLDIIVDDPTGKVHDRMRAGDRYGEALLLCDNPKSVYFTARSHSELALIDRSTFESILADFPAVALPLAEELASELRARNDQLRQVLELMASGLKKKQLEDSLNQLKQSFVGRSVAVRRISTSGLFRRLVINRGNEPTFWMLLGFLTGLAGARLVVHLILKYHLEKQLFALVSGTDPNPVHIHHFNYGLLIVGLVGLVALSPLSRNALRTLAFLFGVGCGLILDEFALFWNLNPDYTQGLSLITAAIAGIILVQLAYFRRFWLALLSRVAQGIRSE
jgi:CRP-like cAMP-binding protein